MQVHCSIGFCVVVTLVIVVVCVENVDVYDQYTGRYYLVTGVVLVLCIFVCGFYRPVSQDSSARCISATVYRGEEIFVAWLWQCGVSCAVGCSSLNCSGTLFIHTYGSSTVCNSEYAVTRKLSSVMYIAR